MGVFLVLSQWQAFGESTQEKKQGGGDRKAFGREVCARSCATPLAPLTNGGKGTNSRKRSLTSEVWPGNGMDHNNQKTAENEVRKGGQEKICGGVLQGCKRGAAVIQNKKLLTGSDKTRKSSHGRDNGCGWGEKWRRRTLDWGVNPFSPRTKSRGW